LKGIEKPVWIVVALILALVILIAMVILSGKAKGTAEGTFKQADIINCCNICCISGDVTTVECQAGKLTDIAGELGIQVTQCEDIPFCKC